MSGMHARAQALMRTSKDVSTERAVQVKPAAKDVMQTKAATERDTMPDVVSQALSMMRQVLGDKAVPFATAFLASEQVRDDFRRAFVESTLTGLRWIAQYGQKENAHACSDVPIAPKPAAFAIGSSPEWYDKLTKRQQEVLGFLAQGMTNGEMARKLSISEATTKIHMAGLLRRLGLRNRTQAAAMAAKVFKR